MTVVLIAEKRCTKCGETKPLSQFHRESSKKDGLRSRCKPCAIEASRQYQAKQIAEVGEVEFRRRNREAVRRHRELTGGVRGKRYSAARTEATVRLIAAHRSEFDALLAAEKYERGLT